MFKIIKFINKYHRQKHRQKYLFINQNLNLTQVEIMLQHLWIKHILNIIVLHYWKNAVYMLGFNPFSAKGFEMTILEKPNYEQHKLQNLHQYQLKISMFEDPIRALEIPSKSAFSRHMTIDIQVAYNMMQCLNASALYILPADGENYGSCQNCSFTGVLADLMAERTDISFNSRYMLDCEYAAFEYIQMHHDRILYLVLPAASLLPMYAVYFRALTLTVWLFQLLSMLLIFIIFITANYVYHSKLSYQQICGIIIGIILHQPFQKFPKNQITLKLLLFNWSMCTYIITNIYLAKLSANFVQPLYESNVNCLNEMHKIKVPIYVEENAVIAIQNVLTAEQWEILKPKLIKLSDNILSLKYIMNHLQQHSLKAGVILRDELAKELLLQTYDHLNHRPNFHMVHQYIHSMRSNYILPKGSAFLYKFNILLTRFYEHGLYEHWSKMDEWNRHLKLLKRFVDSNNSNDKNMVLTLNILQAPFYFVFVGLFASVLCFIGEIVIYKRRNRGKF